MAVFFLFSHSAAVTVNSPQKVTVADRAVESESRSRSRKDFQPEESESYKILTTPTPGRPFAHQL